MSMDFWKMWIILILKDLQPYMIGTIEGKVYINRVDVSVTNRCTLNCEGCNMLMPYYCNPKDRKLEDIKKDLDVFFQWVDTVEDLNLLGGEPLLYPDLGRGIAVYSGQLQG